MKKVRGIILYIVIVIVIVIGVFYIWDQYETYQFSEDINEMTLVDSRDFTKVTVTNYPSMDSYTSYNMDEVNELYRMLEKTPLETTRKGKETTSYFKIKFSDQSLMHSMSYTIYDNDIVKREQDATSVMTSVFLKLQEPFDRALLEKWIEKNY